MLASAGDALAIYSSAAVMNLTVVEYQAIASHHRDIDGKCATNRQQPNAL
jgi:hypothetical protein